MRAEKVGQMHNFNKAELDALKSGYDPVAERSYSLHVDCYRDPKILEAERVSIFHRSWQFLCHGEKLRDPGSYAATDIQGLGVFAIRGDEGKLRAFYNVCRHRAHELVRGEGRKKLITCRSTEALYDEILGEKARSDGSAVLQRTAKM